MRSLSTHWAILMAKQRPKSLFDEDNYTKTLLEIQQKGRKLNGCPFKSTGDALKSVAPQAVVHQSSIYDHGPGGDGGPEVFTPRKNYVRAVTAPAASVLKENIKRNEK